MKINAFVYSVLLGFVIPWLLFFSVGNKETQEATDPQPTEMTQMHEQTNICVFFAEDDIRQMDLEEYILGVLIGEMPVDFELEALKAQAVVARTFAMKTMKNGQKHANNAVCVDSACCQNYYAPDVYLLEGGTQEKLNKFKSAVRETKGQVLTFEGSLIEATYFSCSGGRTEDAQAVWGTDVPYLQAVDSPGEEKATHFMDTVTFTADKFEKLLGQDLQGLPGTWVGEVTYTEGGGVETIKLGGYTYSGTKIRKLLGLNSTIFVISGVGDCVTVTTKGFGHRVGMSQYGADAMAVQGKNYSQILQYYYCGTLLTDIQNV